MAARGQVDTRLNTQGISPFTPENGVQVLEQIIDGRSVQSAAVRVNWPKFIRLFFTERDVPRFFENLSRQTRVQPVNLKGTKTAERIC